MNKVQWDYMKANCICVLKTERRNNKLYMWYEINANCPVISIHGVPANPKPQVIV